MKEYCYLIFQFLLIACSSKVNTESKTVITTQDKNCKQNTQVHEESFESLLGRAKEEGKDIFLEFGFKGCYWCKVFDKYHSDTTVSRILNRYLIIKVYDVNKSQLGSELCGKYGKIGAPSWAIIDPERNIISDHGDTVSGYGNGFPGSDPGMKQYIKALKKAAPDIRQSECEILKTKLQKFGKKSSI